MTDASVNSNPGNSNSANSANSNPNNNVLANNFSFPSHLLNSRPFNPISDKLGEKNHKTWEQQALAAIRGQKLEDHLFPDCVPPQYASTEDQRNFLESVTYQQWLQDDYNLQSWLLASIDPVFKNKMVGCTLSHQIWRTIEEYFAESTRFRVKQLKAQLKAIKKQGQSPTDYVFKIKNIADSLAALGSPLTTEEHKEALLEGLSEEYQMILTTVNTKPELYSLCEVETIIMSYDDMLDKFRRSTNPMVQANFTQSSFPSIPNTGRGFGGRRGRGGRSQRGG
ncbi:hypothetical protein S83_005064 [Arachis hypogaea]